MVSAKQSESLYLYSIFFQYTVCSLMILKLLLKLDSSNDVRDEISLEHYCSGCCRGSLTFSSSSSPSKFEVRGTFLATKYLILG